MSDAKTAAKTALATAVFIAVALLAVVGWFQLFAFFMRALAVKSLWAYVFGIPLWLALPVVAFTQWTRWEDRRRLARVKARAAADPRGALGDVLALAVQLGESHEWGIVLQELWPLLEGAGGLGDGQLGAARAAVEAVREAARQTPRGPMASPSDALPLFDAERRALAALAALKGDAPPDEA